MSLTDPEMNLKSSHPKVKSTSPVLYTKSRPFYLSLTKRPYKFATMSRVCKLVEFYHIPDQTDIICPSAHLSDAGAAKCFCRRHLKAKAKEHMTLEQRRLFPSRIGSEVVHSLDMALYRPPKNTLSKEPQSQARQSPLEYHKHRVRLH